MRPTHETSPATPPRVSAYPGPRGCYHERADAGAGSPRLPGVWLHHRRAQPPPSRAQARDRFELCEPRSRESRDVPAALWRRRELRRLSRGARRPEHRRRGRRRAAVVASRPGHRRPGRGQARPRRETRVSGNRGLRGGDRGTGCRDTRRAGRRERSLQAAGAVPSATRRRARRRRHGLRAVRHDREAPEARRRLAQRRDDGWRRRVLRGGDSLAAPGGQPGSPDHDDSRLPAHAVTRGARPPREEHARRLSATTTAPPAPCSTRARCPRSSAACAGRRSSAAKASSRSNRTARSSRSGGADRRNSCSPASGTSAATAPCIATSWRPFARGRRPR